MKLIDVLILFGSIGFLVIWVDQFLYKGVELKDCYYLLMFSILGFLVFVYRKGQHKIEKDQEKKKELENKKRKK